MISCAIVHPCMKRRATHIIRPMKLATYIVRPMKSKMNDIIIPLLRAAGGTADYQSREEWLEQQIL
jgi:hypothetical protein